MQEKSAMASLSFHLIMRSGPTPGKSFELTKSEIYIGRDIHNDVVINDAEVSRKHARLVIQAGGYVLEDLGSTNGTFVNGQRLMGPHVLRPNELIMLGENVSLVFETTYDADATMVAAPSQAADPLPSQAAPEPAYVPAARQTEAGFRPPEPAPQATYTSQVPPGPAEPYYEPLPEEKKSNRTLLLAGCGCLVVILCIVVAGAVVFDQLNLYCVPPFNAITNFFTNLLMGYPACQ
jgi:pSer/pThr/pTyr-binding forkhead associated (FHA) protein